MKVLLIDPLAKQVTTIEIAKDLNSIYKALDCTTFECPVSFSNRDTIYCDGEYWFRRHDTIAGFKLFDWRDPICGKCLLVGTDDEGDSIDCKTTADELLRQIIWYDHNRLVFEYAK